ncbi:MAG: ATP-dependent zinc metalloprotease FtsH [Eubacteriales bacterium]|nr:ATP-dependent zinc metalloprotease FtsH [Eubacteriales bacterium]
MKKSKSFAGYIIIIIAFVAIATFINGGPMPRENKRIEYPELINLIEKEKVAKVAIRDNSLVGLRTDSKIKDLSAFPERRYDFETTIGDTFVDDAKQVVARRNGVKPEQVSISDLGFEIEYRAPVVVPWYMELIPFVVMIAISMLIWIIFIRSQTGGNGKVMNFGKSRARVNDPSKNQITFADVAGAEEEKEELQEMVDFLKNPKAYIEMGARIPKGVLLVGPPGTGKTLLAKAVAGEAKAPFFSISGSDFVEMFVGVGASRVRDLFDQAKKAAPSIVFIDEIDAVGRHRGAGLGGGHDEREQTLNQLLVEMDGFSVNEGVIVMAATNRRDILDPALLRPGRFDRQVTVNYPDLEGRVAIMKVHSKGKPLADDVDLNNLAKRLPYATGADIENVMNEGAILATRERNKQITQQNLIDAIAKVQMGPEKKSHKVSEKDQLMTAYHEAGHAVIGHVLPKCDEIHLVTIVPRGQSGGHTLSLPSEETFNMSREGLLDRITMALGGHAAEEVALGDFYVGSQSDLKYVTDLARKMVTQFGMSEDIGTLYLGSDEEVFVGMEFGHSKEYSDMMAARVDKEIEKILSSCYANAKQILKDNYEKFENVAKALVKEKTLSRADFISIMDKDSDIVDETSEENTNTLESDTNTPQLV